MTVFRNNHILVLLILLSCGFDKNCESPKNIDIHSWFPNLVKLDLYCGENYNIMNIHLLSKLRELTLKYILYPDETLSKIDAIYGQLDFANIMLDPIGKVRCATEQKGSDRWPLKGSLKITFIF